MNNVVFPPELQPITNQRVSQKLGKGWITGVSLFILLVIFTFFLFFSKFVQQASASTLVSTVENIYAEINPFITQNLEQLVNFKQVVSRSFSDTIDDYRQINVFLYLGASTADPIAGDDQVRQEQLNEIASKIAYQQEVVAGLQIPPHGEQLQTDIQGYLAVLQKIVQELQDFTQMKKDLNETIDAQISTDILKLLETKQLSVSDRELVSQIIAASTTALVSVKSLHSPNPNLDFVDAYYEENMQLIITEMTAIEASLAQGNLTQANQQLRAFHAKYYQSHYQFNLDLGRYVDTQFFENGLIVELDASQKSLAESLQQFAEVYDLEVDSSSVATAIPHTGLYQPIVTPPATPNDGQTETLTKEFYVGARAALANFVLSATSVENFSFSLTDPMGKIYQENEADSNGEPRFTSDKTYKLWQITSPAVIEGFWIMRAEGPAGQKPQLAAHDRGSQISVATEVFQVEEVLDAPYIVVVSVFDQQPVNNAKVQVMIDDQFVSDSTLAEQMIELQPAENNEGLANMVKNQLKIDDLAGVYVGVFDQTDHYGTYCFSARASWPDSSGKSIAREPSAGCQVLSP